MQLATGCSKSISKVQEYMLYLAKEGKLFDRLLYVWEKIMSSAQIKPRGQVFQKVVVLITSSKCFKCS